MDRVLVFYYWLVYPCKSAMLELDFEISCMIQTKIRFVVQWIEIDDNGIGYEGTAMISQRNVYADGLRMGLMDCDMQRLGVVVIR